MESSIIDKIEQPKLKKWLELEDIKNKLVEAVEHKNYDEVADLLCSYVSTAVDLEADKMPWYETVDVFEAFLILCSPNKIPILTKSEKTEKFPWDYDGREWYFWLHKLSSVYGWSAEYVEFMDFNDAISLMQEISIQEQLEKEWEWNLSEMSYSYNSTTKKSEHKPLSRPNWMAVGLKPTDPNPDKPVKILKSMLPAGVIVHLKDVYENSKSKRSDETL